MGSDADTVILVNWSMGDDELEEASGRTLKPSQSFMRFGRELLAASNSALLVALREHLKENPKIITVHGLFSQASTGYTKVSYYHLSDKDT